MTNGAVFVFVVETDKVKIEEYKNRGYTEVKKDNTDDKKKVK